MGITFDISGGEISLTTEGGHSYPRVLHAGGDATGEEIEKKLVRYSKNFGQIEFFPEYLVVDIITDEDSCLGVIAVNLTTSAIEIHPAENIIIASGGIGQLYELTTNPTISTGDGIAMAYRAGASIKDIEFMQFHPTVFKTNNGSLYLITEALRGEGAYLRDSLGNRFMVGEHPRAELAPRDIVVKEMIKVMKDQNIKFVHLDATHLPENRRSAASRVGRPAGTRRLRGGIAGDHLVQFVDEEIPMFSANSIAAALTFSGSNRASHSLFRT